jgi:hypothetical protein
MVSRSESDPIAAFCIKVNALLLDAVGDPRNFRDEYLEIKANGRVYRSLMNDDYGQISWICWEPFSIGPHFSLFALMDANATVRLVQREPDNA